jgi:hypothetical protein
LTTGFNRKNLVLTNDVDDINDEEEHVFALVGFHLIDEPLKLLPVRGISRRSA